MKHTAYSPAHHAVPAGQGKSEIAGRHFYSQLRNATITHRIPYERLSYNSLYARWRQRTRCKNVVAHMLDDHQPGVAVLLANALPGNIGIPGRFPVQSSNRRMTTLIFGSQSADACSDMRHITHSQDHSTFTIES